MRHATAMLLPMLAPVFLACADVQSPVTPRTAPTDHAVAGAAPTRDIELPVVIYSNFGPDMAVDTDPLHAYVIGGGTESDPVRAAVSQQFSTPAHEYTFTRAVVALSYGDGPVDIRVLLQADDRGKPGDIIEEMPLDGLPQLGLFVAVGAPRLFVANSRLMPVLRNTRYWLTLAPERFSAPVGWNWNSTDAYSILAVSPNGDAAGPWTTVAGQRMSAFQIEGRPWPAPQGPILHQATGGGAMIWQGLAVTYAITALQMADGSAKGEVLLRARDGAVRFKGKVTCLAVIENRAFISGDVAQLALGKGTPPLPDITNWRFGLALEDNGEGSNASAPDRVTIPMLRYEGSGPRGVSTNAAYAPGNCLPSSHEFFEWTNGNVQVR